MLISNKTLIFKTKQIRTIPDNVIAVPDKLQTDRTIFSKSITQNLVTEGALFVCDLLHYIEDRKESYRLRNDDAINLQAIIKLHVQLYITSTMVLKLRILRLFMRMMKCNCEMVLKD